MFARSSCLLSSFLIVFIWFGGGVRRGTAAGRGSGWARYGRGAVVGRGSSAASPLRPRRRCCSSATRPPNPDGNPDPGFMFRLRAKSPYEKQTFICTCIWVNLRLIDIALFPVASALRLCALTFRPAAMERSTAPLGRLGDISRNPGAMRPYQAHSRGTGGADCLE